MQNINTILTLDVYDYDLTPSTMKAIALDSNTRSVTAYITRNGQPYDVGQSDVTLTVIRPDGVGAQVTGEAYEYETSVEDTTVTRHGAYAELSQAALAVSGTLLAQFMFTSGEQILRTEIFAINAGKALDASTSTWAGEYQGYNLDELVQNVNESSAKVDAMEQDVSDLKSGLSPIVNNLLPSFGSYVDETQHDPNDVTKSIDINWTGQDSVRVTGTMSPTWNVYSQRIYYSASEFPDGIKAGDKLYISFDNNDLLEQNRGKLVVKSLCLTVMFFFNNSPSDRTTSQFVYDSVELDVPKNATGMQIMLRVQRGQSAITLNPDGTYSITYEYDIDAELANFVISTKNVTINILDKINKKNMPCFVSFIDDDTANDIFCARYYNSCMHNGITGAYAVQTDLLDDTTTTSQMLEYEEQGMGMLTHCSIQTSIYRADTNERLKACIADLSKAKRKMIDCGFLTYNHFVIPYGTKSDDLRDIARYLGFDSAISTSDNIMNRPTDDDRYYIKRYGYAPQSDYLTNANSDYNKVMKLIGDMVKLGAGWVVITTHFCDDWSSSEYRWTTYPYDSTQDSNGYEIGYTEFNDLVAAIKNTGAKIVPYTVGINYFHSGARG